MLPVVMKPNIQLYICIVDYDELSSIIQKSDKKDELDSSGCDSVIVSVDVSVRVFAGGL